MQFCKDCGSVLDIFGNNSSSLCASCIQHKKEPEPKQVINITESPDLLGKAVFTVENGKIVLRSKEGWQLWSAPVDSRTELQAILKSANLIHSIHNKRKNKK